MKKSRWGFAFFSLIGSIVATAILYAVQFVADTFTNWRNIDMGLRSVSSGPTLAFAGHDGDVRFEAGTSRRSAARNT